MTDVSIIIVGTNEKKFVQNCLRSIRDSKTTYSSKVILVDNASTDGTSDTVKQDFKDVKIIRNKRKKGYIYNNNLAMKDAHGRYVLLLNADITLREDTLQVMLKFMDCHPEAAVSGCKLTFDDGTLQLTCRRFPTPLTYISRLPHFLRWMRAGKKLATSGPVRHYLMMDYDHKHTKEVDWFLSAFFLLRKTALGDVGMVGEGLVQPFYLEDMDWCFRAHVKGWKVYYVPETSAVHHYQRGSVKKFGWLSIVHILNILIFFRKHWLKMLLKGMQKCDIS